MVLSKAALLSLAALPATQAFFLIPCWPLSTQRLDPIVYPGEPASHLHSIVGGKAFAPVMDYNTTQTSECTTCMVSKDKSNYWVASLFHQNGDSFELVPQHGSASLYYLNEKTRLGSGEKMEPLPVGLRMLAGDPEKRSGSQAFEDQAINYKCLNYKGTPTDSKGFPDQNCPDGLRAEVTFPSCWDGVNLDSDDHQSHMAYPTVTFEAGACPSTHPHHLVTVKMEVIFKTFDFPFSGKNPFVWSTGDPTGFGLHADLLMGWDYDLLSRAVEQCDNPSGRIQDCAPFAGLIPESQVYLDPKTCEIDSYVNEDYSGKLSKLPGCNTIEFGPGRASKQNCADGASLKGDWSDYTGGIAGAVNSIGNHISSAVAGIFPGSGAAPTGAPAQFYEKPAGDAAPAPEAAKAVPSVHADANGNVVTDWVYVTETVTVTGAAPASTGGWNDAAKRDAEEHIHKHRGHARRSF
ncbi:uncharacterized protein HMPREF1541_07067 [Cyphellophora europaea CBS 101466]|uniref:DUF1996 domain-containing protein n=1 Tax=Cyphellophora europaea (strain CBS 101466) TaxID=1220924 RepID=W2RRT4_CYPE1|nr:uncharacterized protein HMPREF1541_07067 [Cyphellophora europaea CBS 101466]ETN39025.1 hypothetical protein HMPREF1541_07067 [Cyphellophora europaea CBS 101466]